MPQPEVLLEYRVDMPLPYPLLSLSPNQAEIWGVGTWNNSPTGVRGAVHAANQFLTYFGSQHTSCSTFTVIACSAMQITVFCRSVKWRNIPNISGGLDPLAPPLKYSPDTIQVSNERVRQAGNLNMWDSHVDLVALLNVNHRVLRGINRRWLEVIYNTHSWHKQISMWSK